MRSPATARKAMSATPPTTPPTIAPVLFFCSGEFAERRLAEGMADVAESVTIMDMVDVVDSITTVETVESGGIVDVAEVTCRDLVVEGPRDVVNVA